MNDQSDIIWKLLETQRSLITELQASYERERDLLVQAQSRKPTLPSLELSNVRAVVRKAKKALRQPKRATNVALRKSRNFVSRTLPLLRGSK